MALDLIGQAIVLLDATNDKAAAIKLRHIFTQIRYGPLPPKPDDAMKVPLELMRMAQAHLDLIGDAPALSVALSLQVAISQASGEVPLSAGEEIDPNIIALYIDHPMATIC
jgi:hypothetical protein